VVESEVKSVFSSDLYKQEVQIEALRYFDNWRNTLASSPLSEPGGEDSAYERGGDARRKFWIKPLKETDLGVAQAFFDP